jgi:hypothetical protein
VFLMFGLPLDTWARLAVWLAIGLGIYFVYGARHSRIAVVTRPTDGEIRPKAVDAGWPAKEP